MKRWIPLLALFLAFTASAKTLRVAVIDTGLDLTDPRFAGHLCVAGHKDFTGEGINDTNDHGTFIAGLIQQYAGSSDYCMLIYKYYQDYVDGDVNQKHEIEAIQAAIANKADIVNFSGGGSNFNEDEAMLIKYNPRMIFVVAAGNNGKNLDILGNEYYPASLFYGNIEVVGNVDKNGVRSPSSNYGTKVENKELGEMVHGLFAHGHTGYMSGTSMSTATFTGKLIRKMQNAK